MAKALVMMVGVPGSGKTTWAKRILGDKDMYISRDEIRYALLNDKDAYFAVENEVFRHFSALIDNALAFENVRCVFADATHLNEGSRKRLLNALKNKDKVKIYALVLNVSLNHCLRNNNLRQGRERVPDNTIRDMYSHLTAPSKAEGFNGVFYLQEDGMIPIEKIQIFD